MEDRIIIQQRFSVPEDKVNEIPRYDGAIVLPIDEYQALSEQDKEDLKNKFYQGFVDAIKNPPPPLPEVPVEEQVAALEQQIEDHTQQIQNLTQQKEILLQEDE